MRPILVNFTEKLQKKEKVSPERMQQIQTIAKNFREQQQLLANYKKELKDLGEKIQLATNAKIKVKGSIYPGASITISDISMNIKNERYATKFIKEHGEIVGRPL